MSKTWRREERSARRRGKSRKDSSPAEFGEGAAAKEPKVISPEWAWKRVRDHAMSLITDMVYEGLVLDGESDIYCEMIRESLAGSVSNYDPNWIGPDGKKCSPSHYCLMIVDRRVNNIRRNILRVKGNAMEIPISFLPVAEAKRMGYVSGEAISDNCRFVRDLWFRMDVNTFRGMLTPLELEVLEKRLDEVSYSELSRDMGISRYYVMEIMRSIQDKARKCGFCPISDARKRKDEKSFAVGENSVNS